MTNSRNIGTQSELPISAFNNALQEYHSHTWYQYTAGLQDVIIKWCTSSASLPPAIYGSWKIKFFTFSSIVVSQ